MPRRPTYVLQDADEGNAVRVRVNFTDDAGNSETLTSAATGVVVPAPVPVVEVTAHSAHSTDSADGSVPEHAVLSQWGSVHVRAEVQRGTQVRLQLCHPGGARLHGHGRDD